MRSYDYKRSYIVKDIGAIKDPNTLKLFVLSRNVFDFEYRKKIAVKSFENCLISPYKLDKVTTKKVENKGLKIYESFSEINFNSIVLIKENRLYVVNSYSHILLSLKKENKNTLCTIIQEEM